jgi:cardiolipin synthase
VAVLRIELKVDGDEYWSSLLADLEGARRRIEIQALSFEADEAGRAVADAVEAKGALDRRILMDHLFTHHKISDRFLWRPTNLFDRDLRRERRDTIAMVERLRASGAGVRFTNPSGFLLRNMLMRDHKKMVLVDDRVAYVGGFNFSDHNRAWHDMMIRIEDPDVVAFLRQDFDATWRGGPVAAVRDFPGLKLLSLDGRRNGRLLEDVYRVIDEARLSIFIESPYLTDPFLGRLRAARRRGVDVTIVTPADNNWRMYRHAVEAEAERSGFDVRVLGGRMSHLKAMLVDERVLVAGSSNFDVFTQAVQAELIAVVDDATAVEAFRRRVRRPDIRASRPVRNGTGVHGLLGRAAVGATTRLVRAVGQLRIR